MTCRDIIEIIARAEAGLLDPGVSAAFDRHLAECPRCRAERVLATRLTAALRADPGPAPASDFTARVLDRVRTAHAESPQRWWTPIIPAMALVLSILAIRPVLPALPLPGIGEGLRSLLLPALGWMENGLTTLGLGTAPGGFAGALPLYALPAVVFTACVSGILVWVTREAYAYRVE